MITLFGKTYESAGSTNADFIIKTRGQVKIQYGNKYIDLIKNGKINSSNNIDFSIVNSENEISSQNGIYYIQSTKEMCFVINGTKIKVAQKENALPLIANTSTNNELPTGSIIQWYGANIPNGWVLCDGDNNTPNLQPFFLNPNSKVNKDLDTLNTNQKNSNTEIQNSISDLVVFIMKK